MKTTTNTAATKLPSLASVLETMAYHLRTLATECPKGRGCRDEIRTACGLGGHDGLPMVGLSIVIRSTSSSEDPWGVWAQVTIREGLDHTGRVLYQGNRAGAGDAVARAYAPVIAAAAALNAAGAGVGVKKAPAADDAASRAA